MRNVFYIALSLNWIVHERVIYEMSSRCSEADFGCGGANRRGKSKMSKLEIAIPDHFPNPGISGLIPGLRPSYHNFQTGGLDHG